MSRSRTVSMISHKTAEHLGDYAVFDPVEYNRQRQQLSQHRCTRLIITCTIVLTFGFLCGGLFAQQMEREEFRNDALDTEIITNVYFYQVIVKDTHPQHSLSQRYSLSVCGTDLHTQYSTALGIGIVVMIILVICFLLSLIGFDGSRMNERPLIFFVPVLVSLTVALQCVVLVLSVSPLALNDVCPGIPGKGSYRLGGGAGTFIVSLFFNLGNTVVSLWQSIYRPSPGTGYKLEKIYISPDRLDELKEQNSNGSDPIFSDIPTATSYRFVPASRAISGISASAVLVRDENKVRTSSPKKLRNTTFRTPEALEKDKRTCYKGDLRQAYLPPKINDDGIDDGAQAVGSGGPTVSFESGVYRQLNRSNGIEDDDGHNGQMSPAEGNDDGDGATPNPHPREAAN